MKLRNKKTGEIVEYISFKSGGSQIMFYAYDTAKHYYYNSLAELNEEWEDYKEPKSTIKDVWFNSVIADAHIVEIDYISDEEAEKAVEKLKAWERLKDRGFKVDLWDYDGSDAQGIFRTGRMLFRVKDYEENDKDLDLLFGGEDEN